MKINQTLAFLGLTFLTAGAVQGQTKTPARPAAAKVKKMDIPAHEVVPFALKETNTIPDNKIHRITIPMPKIKNGRGDPIKMNIEAQQKTFRSLSTEVGKALQKKKDYIVIHIKKSGLLHDSPSWVIKTADAENLVEATKDAHESQYGNRQCDIWVGNAKKESQPGQYFFSYQDMRQHSASTMTTSMVRTVFAVNPAHRDATPFQLDSMTVMQEFRNNPLNPKIGAYGLPQLIRENMVLEEAQYKATQNNTRSLSQEIKLKEVHDQQVERDHQRYKMAIKQLDGLKDDVIEMRKTMIGPVPQ